MRFIELEFRPAGDKGAEFIQGLFSLDDLQLISKPKGADNLLLVSFKSFDDAVCIKYDYDKFKRLLESYGLLIK